MLMIPMEIINVVYFENGELKILKDATDKQKKIFKDTLKDIKQFESENPDTEY